eukprot:7015770-Pyramimonas_sp.AAC.1
MSPRSVARSRRRWARGRRSALAASQGRSSGSPGPAGTPEGLGGGRETGSAKAAPPQRCPSQGRTAGTAARARSRRRGPGP